MKISYSWIGLAGGLLVQDAAARAVHATRSTSGKRGLAFNDASYANMFTGHSEVTWAYNWGVSQTGLSSSFEYLPMLWGDPTGNQGWINSWQAGAKAAIEAGTTHLLAFNEPDINNLSPQKAAAAYLEYVQPFASSTVKLGAPAVTNGGGQTGITWLQEFMGNCSSCIIDFIPFHWYCQYDNVGYFTDYVQKAHAAAGNKPVWFTEFQGENYDCSISATDAQQAQFMRTVLPWLDSLSYIERYAYFGVFESTNGQNYLLNAQGTALSSSGQTYVSLNNVNSTTPTGLVP